MTSVPLSVKSQSGMTILESLVALLIFSIGILALLAAFARATVVNGDATSNSV